MKKLYIYIDETYQLHKTPQFYAFGGFLTKDIEKMRSEYKKLLRKCDAIKEELKKEFNLQWLNIEIRDSKLSFGLQLADQITGIYREYIKENRYEEFIEKFIINIEEPLSYN